MQALVHAASIMLAPASAGIAGPPENPHVIGHWQVHVEGQSESTLHGGVCCATQVFQLIETQLMLPPSQMFGGGIGGMGQAMLILVAYGGRLASWFGVH
jgi:hypothetical protein